MEDEPQRDHRSKLRPPKYKFQKVLMVALADRHRPHRKKRNMRVMCDHFAATSAFTAPHLPSPRASGAFGFLPHSPRDGGSIANFALNFHGGQRSPGREVLSDRGSGSIGRTITQLVRPCGNKAAISDFRVGQSNRKAARTGRSIDRAVLGLGSLNVRAGGWRGRWRWTRMRQQLRRVGL
jgi:hypothetical protein